MMRSSIRLLRVVPRSARSYCSIPPTSSQLAGLTATTLIIGGLSYTYAVSESTVLRADGLRDMLPKANENVRESVLDQPSLKQNVHRRTKPPAGNATPDVLEEKASQASQSSEGAFNEETGEINWDCPCLGGMASGPCGEDFKSAFSCFVYSEADPKGVDCVDKFKAMQDCFRQHPDVYGDEIDDDQDDAGPAEDPRPKSQLDRGGLPKPSSSEPPPNSPILTTSQKTTHTKGNTKLQSHQRGDTHDQNAVPNSGLNPRDPSKMKDSDAGQQAYKRG